MAKFVALTFILAATAVQAAGIYSYKAEDGSIVFTDEPTKGAKQVKVEEPMTVPAVRPKTENHYQPENKPLWPEPKAESFPSGGAEVPAYDDSSNTSWSSESQGITSSKPKKRTKPAKKADASMITVERKKPKAEQAYKSLRVISPTSGSSRWVGGELTVELAVSPPLQPEHVISLRVDGREVAVGPELQMVMPGIERGGHTLRAAVLDVNTGKQLIVSKQVKFQIHRPNKNQNPQMLHPSVRKLKNQ